MFEDYKPVERCGSETTTKERRSITTMTMLPSVWDATKEHGAKIGASASSVAERAIVEYLQKHAGE